MTWGRAAQVSVWGYRASIPRMHIGRWMRLRFTTCSCAILRKRGASDTVGRAGEVEPIPQRLSSVDEVSSFSGESPTPLQPADLLVELIFFGVGLLAHLLAAVAECPADRPAPASSSLPLWIG